MNNPQLLFPWAPIDYISEPTYDGLDLISFHVQRLTIDDIIL